MELPEVEYLSLTATELQDPVSPTEEETIILNVGGVNHEVSLETLSSKPGTKLSNLSVLKQHYRPTKKDYYFDRHPMIFLAILNYYRTGELHIPLQFCGPSVKKELAFWQIDETLIQECCWINYHEYQEQKESLIKFNAFFSNDENIYKDIEDTKCPLWRRLRLMAWRTLEEPCSSLAGKVYAGISLMMVLLSISIFMLDSHHILDVRPHDGAWNLTMSLFGTSYEEYQDLQDHMSGKHDNASHAIGDDVRFNLLHPAVEILNFFCAGFFTLDLLARIICCPRFRLLVSPLMCIDVVALVPFYVELILNICRPEELYKQSVFDFLQLLQIARILRIFRVAKHYTGIKVILYALKESVSEIILTIVMLCIAMILFASLMFYGDNVYNESSKIEDIMIGCWWAVITLTTVGYGDKVPTSGIGYVVGTVTAFCGVLLLAMTIPIIVSNFLLYYAQSQSDKKKCKTKKPEKEDDCDA
ncbi:potassium voltage-gated channel subfamily C member 1 [Lingula anatina]|uniref:Potassium voltage-gated channel subfamily C member 1 n=1 Tax=Lingula anatina TaxID=7574 RepID=A0A1S3K2Q7_LINAN|nr:potassium voltage-gated channel subfamily C member 1 [Lingula anatina]|eukprot:XP_013416684.1 potassium voltage-gated channel subfamily C member 1 [Lingula anatina]